MRSIRRIEDKSSTAACILPDVSPSRGGTTRPPECWVGETSSVAAGCWFRQATHGRFRVTGGVFGPSPCTKPVQDGVHQKDYGEKAAEQQPRWLTTLRCGCYSSQVLRVTFGVPVVVPVVKPEGP